LKIVKLYFDQENDHVKYLNEYEERDQLDATQ